MGEPKQDVVSAGLARRVWFPRPSLPVTLGVFDATAVFIAVAVARAQAVPVVILAAYAGLLLTLLVAGGVYSEKIDFEVPGRGLFTAGAITLAAMGVITLNFMVLKLELTPAAMLVLWLETVGAVAVGRLIALPIRAAVLKSAVARKTLIVGSGFAATLLAEKIASHPELGLETVGFVDDGPRRSVRGRSEPLLGGLEQLSDIIGSAEARVVIFAYTQNATSDMLAALYRAEPKVEVLMMPRYFEFVSTGMQVEGLAGMPVLRLNRPELGLAERAFKRAEDLLIAGVTSVVLLPLVPLVAIAIKLDSPGPVFFADERIGKGGAPFRMYKFRSMTDDVDVPCAPDSGTAEKLMAGARADDPRLKGKPVWRVTRVGRLLRTTSIDELPQLWNVLRGDMSVVGPRPPLPDEVAAYEEWQKKRLAVSPGITGLWQVSGRSDLPFDEMVWLDCAYVDSWSVWVDLGILLRTIPAVLSRRGAY